MGSESLDESELGAGEEAVERFHADAAMSTEMVVVAEPVLELLLQGVERTEVLVLESRKEPEAYGSEEPLDLAAGGRIEGFAVEQSTADAGAGFGGVAGGEGGSVIAVEAFRDAVSSDGVTEGVEKLRGVLGEGESGAGRESAMVVEDGAEDGSSFSVLGAHVWTMHEVGDPEVVGVRHLELGASSLGTA